MKTGLLFLALVLVGGSALIWIFLTLFQESGREISEQENQRYQEDLAREAAALDDEFAVGAVAHQIQIRIAPLGRILPGLHFAPHRLASLIGLLTTVLAMAALAWCLFVPKENAYHAIELGAPPEAGEE